MTEEIQGAPAPDTEIEEKVDAPEPEQSEDIEPDIIDRAKRMGWKDKTEFNKEPENWVDAKKFVERSETELPVLRERMRHAERQNSEFEKKYGDLQNVLLQVKDLTLKNQQAYYDKGRQEILQQLQAAKDSGNIEAYDHFLLQFADHEKTKPVGETVQPQPQQQPNAWSPGQVEIFAEWRKDNPWFETDPDLTVEAVTYFNVIDKKPENASMSFIKKIQETERYVKQRNASKFGIKQKPGYASVESGIGTPISKTGKSFDEIPSAEKQIYTNMLKHMPWYDAAKKGDSKAIKKMDEYKKECVDNHFSRR